MKLDALEKVTTKSKKRIGRGYGSGVGGHTVGRGTKGQRSRVGKGIPLWFEGGQLPLTKKLPYLRGKLRFQSLNRKPQLVSLSSLEKLTEKEITPALLREKRLIADVNLPVKITGVGVLSRAVQCHGMRASKTAKAQIEKAGGKLD